MLISEKCEELLETIDIILDIIPAINPHSINILIFISTTIPIKADIPIIASNAIKILNKSKILLLFLIVCFYNNFYKKFFP